MTPPRKLLAFLASTAALLCAPTASAAITVHMDTLSKTITMTIDGDSWISATSSLDAGFWRAGPSTTYQSSMFTSTSVVATKTGGEGDWGGPLEMTTYSYIPAGGGPSQLSIFSGLQIYSESVDGMPTNWTGTIVATFDEGTLSYYNTGVDFTHTYFGQTSGTVEVTVVPEPSSLALGGLGLVGLLARRRRVA